MKLIISLMAICIAITNTSCHSKLVPAKSAYETTDKYGNKMLLGISNKKDLQREPYTTWFSKNYDDYKIDTQSCESIKQKLAGKAFEIFMGTWCGDSRREVPRMFKILDYCGIPSSKIKLVMLNNQDSFYKQSPQHEERGMNVHHVPDLIVFDNKKEEGRVIESPVVSLEKDLLAIVKNEKYQSNYEAVEVLVNFLSKNKTPNSESEIASTANMLKPYSKSSNELNTFGYVKMASGEMDKAEAAFKINCILYAADANMFDSLGDFYARNNNRASAKENYEKALQLKPTNEATRKKLEKLQNN